MHSFRKLAAVDLAYLGPKIILTEFALGVIGPIGLGILTLARNRSGGGLLLGCYLITLGINYVPLLVYAIGIVRGSSAMAELADEPDDRKAMFRKYRRLSMLLLLPLVVPIVILMQRRRSRP
jgi:hypothetical protein